MKNFFKHLKQMIVHPVAFFDEVREWEKKPMWIPIVLMIVTGVISGLAAGKMASSIASALPAEQSSIISTIAVVSGVISAPISILAVWAVKGIVYQFILKKMGGDQTLKETLFTTGICAFPALIPALLNTLYATFATATVSTTTFSITTYLAGTINIFILYQLFLTVVGLARMQKLSYKKVAIPVIGIEVAIAILNLVMGISSANATASVMNAIPK